MEKQTKILLGLGIGGLVIGGVSAYLIYKSKKKTPPTPPTPPNPYSGDFVVCKDGKTFPYGHGSEPPTSKYTGMECYDNGGEKSKSKDINKIDYNDPNYCIFYPDDIICQPI